MKPFQEQTFYELLDLPVTATADQVRAAYQHAQEIYAPDSVALYTLVDPLQAEALRSRLHEALQTLTEPGPRAAYNRAVGLVEALAETPAANAENEASEAPAPRMVLVPDPVPPEPAARPVAAHGVVDQPAEPASRAEPVAPAAKPRPPEVGPSTEVTGELLRQLREARGLSLQALSDRTRITRGHLENVEGDRFAQLPPTVYLRGILGSLARELKVDAQHVCRSYLERVVAAIPPTPGTKR